MTQNDVVIQFLREHGQITTYDAFRHDITRLSARIHELRHKKGMDISTNIVHKKGKDGTHKHYSVYKLESES